MLSSVTLFCQVRKIVIFWGSPLSDMFLLVFSKYIWLTCCLWDRSLKVFSKCICHCHCLCLCLCHYLFVGHVMFSHHSDYMSQRSKLSKIALWRCSLNVFVIVFVFVFVVVFFLLVRSCFRMTPINFARFRSPHTVGPTVLWFFRFGQEGWKALNPTQWM